MLRCFDQLQLCSVVCNVACSDLMHPTWMRYCKYHGINSIWQWRSGQGVVTYWGWSRTPWSWTFSDSCVVLPWSVFCLSFCMIAGSGLAENKKFDLDTLWRSCLRHNDVWGFLSSWRTKIMHSIDMTYKAQESPCACSFTRAAAQVRRRAPWAILPTGNFFFFLSSCTSC